MIRFRNLQLLRSVFASAFLPLLALAGTAGTAHAEDTEGGYVFSETNAVAGNRVAVFERGESGRIEPAYTIATGGLGTGAGLGSQGALALSADNRWLVAVNAASNDITLFRNEGGELHRIDKAGAHGSTPISVTIHGRVVYVLNAAGDGNIAGFRIGNDAKLHYIDGSTRPLSSSHSGPAEVSLDRSGDSLVVTEKTANKLDTYAVQDGVASGPAVFASSGGVPFGFDFGTHDQLIVSEAAGNAPHSALSSYKLNDDNTLGLITASLPDRNDASCWVVVSQNGRLAFVTNTGSDDVSVLGVSRTGGLTLLESDGVSARLPGGTHPTDEALTAGDRFLYVLGGVSGSVTGFRVGSDGSLHMVGAFSRLPVGSVGLIAR